MSEVASPTVFHASYDAPSVDPTAAYSRDLAVDTLPLSRPDECVRRLRASAPQPTLVVTDQRGASALHQITAEASLFADLAVAVSVVRLPNLASRLLTSIATSEAHSTGLANAVALADLAPRFLHSEVLVPTINKLDTPPPTMVQAARSLLPGSKFIVVTGTRDEVVDPAHRRLPEGFDPLACASSAQLLPWMQVLIDGADSRFSRVPAWEDVAPFGNERWAEIVWWDPRAVVVWSEQVRAVEFPVCYWCDNPRVRDVCAFCGCTAELPDSLTPAKGGTQ
jgi:hypothetical protein